MQWLSSDARRFPEVGSWHSEPRTSSQREVDLNTTCDAKWVFQSRFYDCCSFCMFSGITIIMILIVIIIISFLWTYSKIPPGRSRWTHEGRSGTSSQWSAFSFINTQLGLRMEVGSICVEDIFTKCPGSHSKLPQRGMVLFRLQTGNSTKFLESLTQIPKKDSGSGTCIPCLKDYIYSINRC